MREYLVTFGIFPSETAAKLRLDRTVTIKVNEIPDPIQARVQVRGATIRARVQVDGGLAPQTVVNILRSDLAPVIDTLAYLEGCGWQIEVLSLRGTEPPQDYVWTGYVDELRDPGRERIATEEQVYAAMNMSTRVSDALSDLRRAMRDPWDSAFYSQRAIEMVRRYWEDTAGLSEKAAWSAMRTDLNVTESAIRSLSSAGNRQRHGHRDSVTSQAQGAGVVLASSVVTRFVLYLIEPSDLASFAPL